jgi:patatin-like phospholipase/acyl hydrolase
MLLELEKELGCPVIHCFDWVAGTSTGGILTLGLAAGIVSSVEPLKAACQKKKTQIYYTHCLSNTGAYT